MGTERSRRTIRIGAVGAVLAALVLTVGVAPAEAAGLLIADGGLGGVLEITEHSVDVTINNGIAVTEVTQVFRNTEQRQVEALYTFPVPKGASVANFSMWINGKEMVGEVVEKQRARDIYDSYKQIRRDPGLLEQKDYRTFEMRIFPIGPGAEQRVRITYYQELDTDHDWATYVYPLATASRVGVDSRATGRFAFNVHAKSEVPVVAVTSPSHGKDAVVVQHDPTYFQASLESAEGDLNKDVVVAYQLQRPRTGLDLIASRKGGADGTFCLTLTAGKELEQRNAPMDYVFVLDISGSMEHAGKLDLSRDTVGAFVDSLGEADRFEIITFNVAAQTLFGRITPADADSKRRAAEYLAGRQAKGGTVLGPALDAAYRFSDPDRTLNVVVLSDGMTEQQERDALVQRIKGRPANVRVFCVGVGNEVNRPLLGQLAEEAGGLAAFLSRGDDFQRQAKAFRRKLTRPAATDVAIEFEGGGVYDVIPRKLPNLYHGAPVRLYGRYRRDGQVKVTVRAKIGAAEMDQAATIELPRADDANPQIERMWAWHKIQHLLADASGAADPAVQAEIVRLGEAYSIATEYTSFIVLENDAEYRRWKIDRRNALQIQRDRASREKVQEQLAAIRANSARTLGPARVEPGGDGPVLASAQPEAGPPNAPASAQPAQSPPDTSRRRGWDISLPTRGGGPVGVIGWGAVAALVVATLRRRKDKGSDGNGD